MKCLNLVAIGAVGLTALGCQKAHESQWEKGELNRGMVLHHYNHAADQAVLAEQTLFPYHFERNGADLNSLGERDLEILARDYRNNPGTLNVRKGPADDDLYDARVQQVLDSLASHRVDIADMTIADGLVQGEGVLSARALLLDERTAEPVQSTWQFQPDR